MLLSLRLRGARSPYQDYISGEWLTQDTNKVYLTLKLILV